MNLEILKQIIEVCSDNHMVEKIKSNIASSLNI